MPTYDIAGIPVDFPFEAYSVQLVYMEKVVLALEEGNNALLESPTGTGKTLCLLCAALGWRRAQAARMQQQQQQPPPLHTPGMGHNSVAPQRGADWAASLAASVAGGGGGSAGYGKLPRIIYASRTHSQLQQVVRELRRTPHRPLVCMLGSREQYCCNPDVRNLTGAALNASCQALTAANSCSYYRRVQDEKKRSGFVGHPQAKEPEESRSVPDIEDFKLHAEKKLEMCPFYLARELQTSSDILFMPYNYMLDPRTRKALNIDLQRDVLIFDEAHNIDKICAEAASFNLTTVELAGAARELDRCIDGARNQAGGDADAIDGGGRHTDDDDGGGMGDAGGGGAVNANELTRVKEIVLRFDEAVAKLPLAKTRGAARFVRHGDGLRELFGTVGVRADNFHLLVQQCDKCVTKLGESARFGVASGKEFALARLAEAMRVAFDTERPPSQYRLCVQEMEDRQQGGFGGGGDKRGRGTLDAGPKPRTLGYWCFHSGAAMRQLKEMGVRSVLLTSGTLSPLSSFADELGLPFVHRLENPHVIQPSTQLMVGVLPRGPANVELTSAYNRRDDDAAPRDLGNALVNFARQIPQGVLVFFPSYSALSSTHASWQRRGADGGESVVERLKKWKTLVVEPRDGHEAKAAMEASTRRSSRRWRAAWAARCSSPCAAGKLSEGVDFADAACRGVVITGLPLPPIVDARIELKRSFLDERIADAKRGGGGGGAAAAAAGARGGARHAQRGGVVQQQAMRAVNQAVGRVIRHVNDYGAVLLCESRFGQQKWVDGLSLWLRPHVKQFTSFAGGARGAALLQGACRRGASAPLPPLPPPRRRLPTDGRARRRHGAGPTPAHAFAPPPRRRRRPRCSPDDGPSGGGGGGGSGDGRSAVHPADLPRCKASSQATPRRDPLTRRRLARDAAGASGTGQARPRKAWAPREERRPAASGGGAIAIGGGSSTASSAPPAPAPDEPAGVTGGGSTAHPLLQMAQQVLDKEAYGSWQAMIKAIKTINKAPGVPKLPPELIHRAHAIFSAEGRGELLQAFLRFEGIRDPPVLQPLRDNLKQLMMRQQLQLKQKQQMLQSTTAPPAPQKPIPPGQTPQGRLPQHGPPPPAAPSVAVDKRKPASLPPHFGTTPRPPSSAVANGNGTAANGGGGGAFSSRGGSASSRGAGLAAAAASSALTSAAPRGVVGEKRPLSALSSGAASSNAAGQPNPHECTAALPPHTAAAASASALPSARQQEKEGSQAFLRRARNAFASRGGGGSEAAYRHFKDTLKACLRALQEIDQSIKSAAKAGAPLSEAGRPSSARGRRAARGARTPGAAAPRAALRRPRAPPAVRVGGRLEGAERRSVGLTINTPSERRRSSHEARPNSYGARHRRVLCVVHSLDFTQQAPGVRVGSVFTLVIVCVVRSQTHARVTRVKRILDISVCSRCSSPGRRLDS